MQVARARQTAQRILQQEVPSDLSYHCFDHTCWVVESSLTIAHNEGVQNDYQLSILETAAWFHDIGFVHSYTNHEEAGCAMVSQLLPEMDYDPVSIAKICELIMATQLPQSPCCRIGAILCDADLDYLGREDFPEWSERLKREWLLKGIVATEAAFYEKQFHFLSHHFYHTKDASQRRDPLKKHYLSLMAATTGFRLPA